jgi:hypothetical protein
MDLKCNLYIDMVKLISDIYKDNKDYHKTLEIIKKFNIDNYDLIDEWKNILRYIEKLYISYEKKNNKIQDYMDDIIIKNGVDNSYDYLIDIYKKIYKDYTIDIELMLLLIIPSISIKINNRIEIIDFNIGSRLNNRILNIVSNTEFINEKCSICLDNFNKFIIISNCCCNKTCLRCFNLINGKCAICKKENPIIIIN